MDAETQAWIDVRKSLELLNRANQNMLRSLREIAQSFELPQVEDEASQ